MELLDLCYDVLIRILEGVDPPDLAKCSKTSWGLNNFIKDNQALWKAHYLRNLDDPRGRPSDPDPDWLSRLQEAVHAQKILNSDDADAKRRSFKFIATQIEDLLRTAIERDGVSKNKAALTEVFNKPSNLDAFLYRSSLYHRAGTESQDAAETEEDRQMSAKLHCLYGVPSGVSGRRSLSTHAHARARVYDLRSYTKNTKWGPFRDDGSMKVDWEMLESIMIDLGYNSGTCCRRFTRHFKQFEPVWSEPFGGIVRDKPLKDYAPKLLMEPDLPLHLKDPYNISGEWLRIVCFLDYNDLHAFNFMDPQPSPDAPRDPINTDEAIRHIHMRLQVTSVESAGPFDNLDLPVTHFTGRSRSVDAAWDPNANSRIRGTVKLTPEGEVRWTTISIFYGEERWRSEGIQVGGRNSKRGVIGTWFDKDYDPHGPAGPTAFWKVSDEIGESDDEDSDDSEMAWV
ncbi:hypothetical protein BDV96DRAFT_571564 [Lophiotrema nucula]|uniref:F-box domain-containing protein n=1 Tax=Lophiotrema nucula TaxID=690887 RepID=A0A6A5ZFH6_9PLEO|nr:hypothetical protein BDV96DRAFT_571564 [Lophiotrema nucula]